MAPKRHEPVLVNELAEFIPDHGLLIDGTVGDGGHLALLIDRTSKQDVIGIDRDPHSLKRTRQFLGEGVDLRIGSYADLMTILKPAEVKKISFVLLDLGYSSAQIDDQERGFSFQQAGPLDMRYNQDDLSIPTAADIVNRVSRPELEKILREYGEEHFAGRIARVICERRKEHPIKTTKDLAELVAGIYPRFSKEHIHPATKTFQALRIYVNQELSELKYFVDGVVPDLPQGCMVAIISFHSLEDRIVKRGFMALAKPGKDNFGEPITPQANLLNKHVIKPSETEKTINPRSRSAKLRVLQKTS